MLGLVFVSHSMSLWNSFPISVQYTLISLGLQFFLQPVPAGAARRESLTHGRHPDPDELGSSKSVCPIWHRFASPPYSQHLSPGFQQDMARVHTEKPAGLLLWQPESLKSVTWWKGNARECINTSDYTLLSQKKSPTPVGINRFNIMKRGAAGCVWLLLAWCTAASSLRSGIIHLLCYTDLETFHSRRSDYRSHSEPHRAGCAFYDLWRYCVSASQFQLFVFNKNQTQLTLSNFSCLDIRLLMDVSVLVPTWGEVYELLTHTCGCQ